MLQACPKCGAANSESADICYVCDAALSTEAYSEPLDYSSTRGQSADANEDVLEPVAVPSSEPEWRLEVAHRLESYRARRRKLRGSTDDSQTALPFAGDSRGSSVRGQDSGHAAPGRRSAGARPPQRVGIEIAVVQPSLDFASAENLGHHPSAPLVPVADPGERVRAGLLDALFLGASFVGFLILFGSLGGQLTLGKLDAAVFALTFFLFYAQYFCLFTFFNGSTPGMKLRGLRVVGFDGSEPTAEQLLWRSFGYLISAGTLFLGFLWSLWDEDRLTWQDRISQTYITHAPDL